MKNKLAFSLEGIDSLRSMIMNGISGYAINSHYGLTTTIWLFLCSDSVLTIQSTMNELGGWEEIGTLVFKANAIDQSMPKMIPLSSDWIKIASVEKLLIEDDEFIAECGLVIKNVLGEALTVACGADVCSIQMQAPFFSGAFNSEYDFARYSTEILDT